MTSLPLRSRRVLSAFAGTALLATSLIGCGTENDPADSNPTNSASPEPTDQVVDAAALEGLTFSSTSVEGHDLVAGSTIEMSFEDGSMSVNAGCNTIFGAYEVTESVLAWSSGPGMSMMACPDDLMAQDQWLSEFLTAGVNVTHEGEDLTLAGEDAAISLSAANADDLTSLFGKTWTVIATVSGDTTSRLPTSARSPRLDVSDDGMSRLFTGCRSGRTRVLIDAGEVSFVNTKVQEGQCAGAAKQVDRAVLALLDGTADNVVLNENLLIVTRGGEGLMFEIK